jgi:hypothetical protein
MDTSDQITCLDPYFTSFEESLSHRNYKPETLARPVSNIAAGVPASPMSHRCFLEIGCAAPSRFCLILVVT